MRIAVIVNTFPSLSERFILDQLTGLLDLGHQVEILAREKSHEAVIDDALVAYRLHERLHILGIPSHSKVRYLHKALTLALKCIHKCPLAVVKAMNCFKYPDWDALFLLAGLHDRNCDLVIAQFGPNGELAARLKQGGAQWPLLTIFRGYDVRWTTERGKKIYHNLFERGDYFLGVSRDIVRQLGALGIDATKTRQHSEGIDLEKFYHPKDRKPWAPHEPLVLLTVARLHPVKGLDYGIKAFKKLLERNPRIRLEYRLVGSGPAEAHLRKLVDRLALREEIRFMGGLQHDEVVRQYQQAHLFVLPSIAEGLPVALREAMASELPVVATAVGGVGEVVVHGESGLLVPSKEADALADGLQCLIDAPQTWPAMGRRARRQIATKYNMHSANREFERICRGLVASERKGVAITQSMRGRLSVIIPVRNRSDELAECLDGLFKQQSDLLMQIIVIDDASDEDGPRQLAENRSRTTYLRLEQQRGSAYCKNLGLQHAHGEFVLFLDSDVTFISDTTLTTMMQFMQTIPECGQVGGEAIVDDSGRPKFIFGRRLDTKTGASAWQFIPIDHATPRMTRFECDYVPTSNCMVRRDVALQVRGFDDAYLGLGEDKDFGYRVKRMGYQSYVLPDSVVHHHFSPKGRTHSGLTKAFRTQIRFTMRHFGYVQTMKMATATFLRPLLGNARKRCDNADVDIQRFEEHHRTNLLRLQQPTGLVSEILQECYRGYLFLSALLWNLFKRRGLRRDGSIHFSGWEIGDRNVSGLDRKAPKKPGWRHHRDLKLPFRMTWQASYVFGRYFRPSHSVEPWLAPALEGIRRWRSWNTENVRVCPAGDEPTYFVRFVPTRRFGMAVRFLWASRHLPQAGLQAPQPLWTTLAKTKHGWAYAIGLSELKGEPLDAGIPGVIEALAHELICWHTWDTQIVPWSGHRLSRLQSMSEADLIERFRFAPSSIKERVDTIRRTWSAVFEDSALGEFVVSHGDLHPSNILTSRDGRLGWLDFDRVCVQPRWVDLAEVGVRLLRLHPTAIDRFEEQYFAGDEKGRSDWQRHRLTWYRLILLWQSLLRPEPVFGPSAFGRQPMKRCSLALCLAALDQEDSGQSSGELVESINMATNELLANRAGQEVAR